MTATKTHPTDALVERIRAAGIEAESWYTGGGYINPIVRLGKTHIVLPDQDIAAEEDFGFDLCDDDGDINSVTAREWPANDTDRIVAWLTSSMDAIRAWDGTVPDDATLVTITTEQAVRKPKPEVVEQMRAGGTRPWDLTDDDYLPWEPSVRDYREITIGTETFLALG